MTEQEEFEFRARFESESAPKQEVSKPQAKPEGSTLQNMAGGILRGAGSIGATLLTPLDAAARAVGIENDFIGRTDRRDAMDSALRLTGVDTNSLAFQGAKLGTEIAGTSGIGGAIAKPVAAFAPKLASAISSGGFITGGAPVGLAAKAGDAALRVAGGAINGGAAAGLVNPEDVGTGAVIGGALPGAVKSAAMAGSMLKNGSQTLLKNTLGMTTGAGGESIANAYKAGKAGSTAFVDNMRGNVPIEDVVSQAKEALTQMRLDRAAQYTQGMKGVTKDKSVLNFAPIDNAMSALQSMGSFKGQVINKNAAGTVDELSSLVGQWKSLDPAEFHTPEGLDALKRAIGDVRDSAQFGTPARKAADTVYNAVKKQIEMQAPDYSKVMKDYSEASSLIGEIEKSLSLNPKASVDTSLRKLQSLMRNNVNTNYGNRLDLMNKLEQQGGKELLPSIAGQALNSWTPRGLQGLAATGTGAAGLMNPTALLALPAASPRLMGEVAYGLGSMSRGAKAAAEKIPSVLRLPKSGGGLLDFERVAPILATAPVLAINQR